MQHFQKYAGLWCYTRLWVSGAVCDDWMKIDWQVLTTKEAIWYCLDKLKWEVCVSQHYGSEVMVSQLHCTKERMPVLITLWVTTQVLAQTRCPSSFLTSSFVSPSLRKSPSHCPLFQPFTHPHLLRCVTSRCCMHNTHTYLSNGCLLN